MAMSALPSAGSNSTRNWPLASLPVTASGEAVKSPFSRLKVPSPPVNAMSPAVSESRNSRSTSSGVVALSRSREKVLGEMLLRTPEVELVGAARLGRGGEALRRAPLAGKAQGDVA